MPLWTPRDNWLLGISTSDQNGHEAMEYRNCQVLQLSPRNKDT